MNNDAPKSTEKPNIPESYERGQELNWEVSPVDVVLFCELPFWIMVPNCPLEIEVNNYEFKVEIRDDLIEKYAEIVGSSKAGWIYVGPPNPDPNQLDTETKKDIQEHNVSIVDRKCKTVFLLHSTCNEDVLRAAHEQDVFRSRSAQYYLQSFCEAHIEVINQIIQHYRLSTYDYFPYEVNPWDVPFWFLLSERFSPIKVDLLGYPAWDAKPVIIDRSGSPNTYKLIDSNELQQAMSLNPSAGEYELLDALNFIERGDYSDAVRRITTAIEAQLESLLRQELLKSFPLDEVEKKLEASQNDFPGRLRQYLKLSGRKMPEADAKELDTTRNLRHAIVHNGLRITFHDRQKAYRAVDTGRWIFNWFENNPVRWDIREKRIAMRSLGRHSHQYDAEITPTGVVVHKPSFK